MGRVLAVIIWIITLLSVLLFVTGKWWFPEGISSHAPALDRQFLITIVVVGIAFTAAQIGLGWMVWKYRDTGKPGDPAFDAFYASQVPSLADFARQQQLNRDAAVALLDKIGPVILLTHSQSGAFSWPIAGTSTTETRRWPASTTTTRFFLLIPTTMVPSQAPVASHLPSGL